MGLLVLFAVALTVLVVVLAAQLSWEMRHPPRHTIGYAIARGMAVDPGAIGLPFEAWTLERPGGVQLPVWIVNAGDQRSAIDGRAFMERRGRGLTAVLVHGWGHSRIDALARIAPPDSALRSCERVVLFDLRGHGEATGTSRLGDAEVGDLAAVLERLGHGPFVLIGHSMGAVVALAAAARSGAPGDDRDAGAIDPSRQGAPGDARIAGVIAYGPYVDFRRSLCGRLRGAGLPTRPITDLAMLVHRAMGATPRHVRLDEVRRMACPLLVIHGSDDRVVTIAESRHIVQAARDGALIEIPGADHLNAHEIGAARHDEAVREFLMKTSRL